MVTRKCVRLLEYDLLRPNSNVTTLDFRTPLYEWYVVTCESKNGHQEDVKCLQKIEVRTCSKYANHSRFNNQHDWGNLYDHLMNTRVIWPLIMNKIITRAPNIMKKKMAMDTTIQGFRYRLALHVCFLSHRKRVTPTILGSTVNMIGATYTTTLWTPESSNLW